MRISEVFDEAVFERKLRQLADGYRKRFGDLLKYDVEEEIARFKVYFLCFAISHLAWGFPLTIVILV